MLWLTVDEAASLLRVKVSWLYERTRLNEVPHIKLGKYLRFDQQELLAWTAQYKRDGRGRPRGEAMSAGRKAQYLPRRPPTIPNKNGRLGLRPRARLWPQPSAYWPPHGQPESLVRDPPPSRFVGRIPSGDDSRRASGDGTPFARVSRAPNAPRVVRPLAGPRRPAKFSRWAARDTGG